jgi:hypothetical protein
VEDNEIDINEIDIIVDGLDKEWDIPHGFFYKSRQGVMDEEGFFRTISLLEKSKEIASKSSHETMISKKLVRAIWFLPLFLSWQDERIKRNGFPVDIYMGQWVTQIEQFVEDILGTP